jgi:hypothetical protein
MFKRFMRVLALSTAVTLLASIGYAEEPPHPSDTDRDDHFSSNPEPSAIILLGTALAGTTLFLLRRNKPKA